MSLRAWLGRTIGLGKEDIGFWSAFFGGGTWSGRSVTIESALKLSAWWACNRVITETVAMLPVDVLEKQRDGTLKPAADHPLESVLSVSPNTRQTVIEFLEGLVLPICMVGNSYAEITRNVVGDVTALQPIPFDPCPVYRTERNELRYRWVERGERFELPADRVLHIRGFGAGGDLGLSPVTFARETLGGAMATEEASARAFGQGLRLSGFLMFPVPLKPEQRKQARENIAAPLEGVEGEGKIGILEGGTKFQPTGIPAKDAEMVLSRRFNVEDICRWMRVPPIIIGHAGEGQTMWGTGVEQILLGWLALGLAPYLRRIEAACEKHLVKPAERGRIKVRFNVEALLRADSAARAQFLSTMVQNGIYTRDFARGKENLPPLPGGDKLTVQSNLVPLEQLGQVSSSSDQALRNALRQMLADIAAEQKEASR